MQVTSSTSKPKQDINNRKKVKIASVAGSAVGIATAVAGVYAMAKKGNPAASLKNFNYSERDMLLIGAGSVLGGLTAGLVTDKNKENKVPKIREATQQMVGSIACPIGFLAVGNKILEKTKFKLPQINSTSKPAQIANSVLKVLPKVVVTIGSLVSGMEVGNKVMNVINNKVFKEEVKHNVKPEDYLVHADDICVGANVLLKDVKAISGITSKILPATFIISGTKTGMAKKD